MNKNFEFGNTWSDNLGKDGCAKSDEFSEKIQTAFNSTPPPLISENYVAIFFYNGYGQIHARRYEDQIVCEFIL